MKRKLTALLCAMLIGCSAMAESPIPTPTPAPEVTENEQSSGSMSVTLNNQALTLEFDPDPQYSICRDGYVQASFYAYGEGDLLYELYMTFPMDVTPDESISPETSLLNADLFSGLYLYTSTSSSEICSAATQYLTGAYPEGSDYTITFTEVSGDRSATTFVGSISAMMVQVDQNYNPTTVTDDFAAEFRFTMNLGNETAQPEPRQPESTKAPDQPEASSEPDNPKNESPYQLPDAFLNPYPPMPPSKLITPANAQRI